MTENAHDGPTGTENARVDLHLTRKAVLDKSLSKTALRALALLSDPLMDNYSFEWDDDVFARTLGVQRRTFRRAVDELMAGGYYGITLRIEKADGSVSESHFDSIDWD